MRFPDSGRLTPQAAHRRFESSCAGSFLSLNDREVLLSALLEITEEVSRRARAGGHRGRRVALKVRYAPFETHTAQTTLAVPTNTTEEVYRAARELFERTVRVPPRQVRLLGVSISGLGGPEERQLGLFEEGARRRARRVDATVDEIVERLGRKAIRRAGSVGPKEAKEGGGGGR